MSTSPTRIRLSARALSALGRGVGLGRWFPLAEEWVLEQACHRTGLSDWGDSDFREPLGLLLADARRADLPLLGRIGVLETLLRCVANRLRVRDALQRSPETVAIHVARPVFVIGLRGSGLRVLQRLLAAMPTLRAPRFWEVLSPAPPQAGEVDERQREARDLLRVGKWLVPELVALGPIDPDAAEECWPLLFPTLHAPTVAIRHEVPSYADWLWAHDARAAYRFYASTLRLLLRQGPRRQLVLAAPDHLWFLDTLLATFPDACVVWVHRDPVSCAASTAAIASLARRTVGGRVDPTRVGPTVAEHLALGLWRAMSARHPGDTRFLDVAHTDLMRDPVGVARTVAEAFALSWNDDDQRAARRWVEASGPPGLPSASPETYAIDRSVGSERFAAYRERFGVPEERGNRVASP